MNSVRLMLKDFTINLLVGLSYPKLKKIFYGYFGILSLANVLGCLIEIMSVNTRFLARQPLSYIQAN